MSDLTGMTIPAWLTDVGIVGLVIFFGLALARNWIYTRGQVNELLKARSEAAAIWEKIAEERQQVNMQLNKYIEPVMQSNEAILRAVKSLQRQQQQRRESRYPLERNNADDT